MKENKKEDIKDENTIKKLSKDMEDLRKGLNEIYSAIKEKSPDSKGTDYHFKEYLVYDLEMILYYLKKIVRKNPFNERYNNIENLVFLIHRIEHLIEVIDSKK